MGAWVCSTAGDNVLDRDVVKLLFQYQSPGIQCQLCQMIFTDQSEINAHYDTAHTQASGGRPEHPNARYPCDVCGKKFVTKKSQKLHASAMHGLGDVRKFKCDICSRVFNQKVHMMRHIKRAHCDQH